MTTLRPGDSVIVKTPGLLAFYRPANARRDLPPGSGMRAMDSLLMSEELQGVADDVASAIREDARALATAQGLASSGRYISSFRSAEGEPRVLPGEYPNPRRTAIVYNDTPYAATLERGRKGENGHYILTRASEPYHVGGV